MDELTYEEAITRASMILDTKEVDAFQLSMVLAYLWDKPKEKTLNDIVNETM